MIRPAWTCVGMTGVAGGVGSRVLILLDGHPMLSADGGEIIWEALPLLDVDRVEVVKGAYSAVYGSNALGGVFGGAMNALQGGVWSGTVAAGPFFARSAGPFTTSVAAAVGGA